MSDNQILTAAETKSIIDTANAMADAAREVILSHFRSNLLVSENKSLHSFDPVTDADKDAEKVMIDLVEHGIPRDEAHEILREASFAAVANKEELIDVCSRTPAISAAFSAEELEAMFDPANHIGVSGELVDECVALARAAIK